MGRRAKPLQQQVELLKSRGMSFADEEYALEKLMEIGWYRLSLYWFPYELRYPDVLSDKHRFAEGVTFEDALMLYAFDFKMRNMLSRMLERVETAFRTYMIYLVSTRYPDSPFWFADAKVVSKQQAQNFERTIYVPLRKLNDDIKLHHKRYPHDRFAPAWKTLEFVTFGAICSIYASLNSEQLRHDVSRHFGVDKPEIFENYLESLRALRNTCAHGNVLYAFASPVDLRRGPAELSGNNARNLGSTIKVLHYVLRHITMRGASELKQLTESLAAEHAVSPHVRHVLGSISGIKILPRERHN